MTKNENSLGTPDSGDRDHDHTGVPDLAHELSQRKKELLEIFQFCVPCLGWPETRPPGSETPDVGRTLQAVQAVMVNMFVAEKRLDGVRARLKSATSDLSDLNATFELRHNADSRARKYWSETHPETEGLVWPDHADMVTWLMDIFDKIATLLAKYDAARVCELPDDKTIDPLTEMKWKWADNFMVDLRRIMKGENIYEGSLGKSDHSRGNKGEA